MPQRLLVQISAWHRINNIHYSKNKASPGCNGRRLSLTPGMTFTRSNALELSRAELYILAVRGCIEEDGSLVNGMANIVSININLNRKWIIIFRSYPHLIIGTYISVTY